MIRIAAFLATIVLTTLCWGQSQTSINTVGSDNATAISGFDVVAFFAVKKATIGSPQLSHAYAGATWLFSSPENLKSFQSDPEKFVPAWGGQCALAVSENGLSQKKLSGDFEIVDGKLYLFAYGNNAKEGPRNEFMYGRWGRAARTRDGEKYWPELKRGLEDGSIAQPNSSSYKKTRFE